MISEKVESMQKQNAGNKNNKIVVKPGFGDVPSRQVGRPEINKELSNIVIL